MTAGNGGVGKRNARQADGFQVAAGYKVNANMQVSIGWQYRDYSRTSGLFYNGRPDINMNAAFLSLGYSL